MDGIQAILLTTCVVLFVGLLHTQRTISKLKQEVVDRTSKETPEVQQLVTLSTDHVDCVIKCVGCGKYQIHGEQWMSHEDFVQRTKQSDVLGGVCPSCQVPSNT